MKKRKKNTKYGKFGKESFQSPPEEEMMEISAKDFEKYLEYRRIGTVEEFRKLKTRHQRDLNDQNTMIMFLERMIKNNGLNEKLSDQDKGHFHSTNVDLDLEKAYESLDSRMSNLEKRLDSLVMNIQIKNQNKKLSDDELWRKCQEGGSITSEDLGISPDPNTTGGIRVVHEPYI